MFPIPQLTKRTICLQPKSVTGRMLRGFLLPSETLLTRRELLWTRSFARRWSGFFWSLTEARWVKRGDHRAYVVDSKGGAEPRDLLREAEDFLGQVV